ncbi:hypothetical protein [Cognatishimia sp. MH4019]|uniref:hypothetical protein n=1 Tax=Cognatishimia sp. MH4019 TaxID=2854030 RepID=UPI001CD37C19|nr:hypothetical protein [Cognatishimia sp. MH4019]
MAVTLAFYKGRAKTRWHRFQDASVRLATRSRYSHVELIAGTALHGVTTQCLSASGRDGGVRVKRILLKPESWDLVELRIDPVNPAQFIHDRIGAQYDYKGILLSQVLALGRHYESRWFCSEICAAALDLPNPQRVSPQFLFDVVTWGHQGIENAG